VDPLKLGSEVYPPDEFSPHKFEWKEQPLKAGHERPVIIHRAILGSVERFMAILTEHLAGKWPLWLSPRQVVVCSISEKYLGYARKVYEELKEQGFQVEIDDSDASISKKVRNG
jgi:threonyl-tRNA synthetase